jgi:hypothetical protein
MGVTVIDLGYRMLGSLHDPLQRAERAAQRAIGSEMTRSLELVRRFSPVIEYAARSALASPTSSADARSVATKLLFRIYDDLRSLVLLAERGYPLQAASIAASVYETGFSLALVCADFELARKWAMHDDPTRSWHPVKDLARRARMFMNDPNASETAARDYKNYRQLCMGKHANPLLQLQHGHVFEDLTVIFTPGPDTSEAGIRGGMFALEHAALYALIGITYYTTHIAHDQRGELPKALDEISRERSQLHDEAKLRWGTEDPFPGKW